MPENKDVEEEVVTEESTTEETVVEEVAVEEEIIEPPIVVGPKYYVVAGSFKVESNAINYNNKLRNEGFNSENLGMINGFYMVSFDGFVEYEDALKLWKLEKAGQPDAWIMKY